MANQGFRGYITAPFMYQDNDTSSMALGIDGADSNKIKFNVSASPGVSIGSASQLVIDPSANGHITLDPNGSGTVDIAYATQFKVAVYGASGALSEVAAVGTAGQALLSNGAGLAPTFQTIAASGAIMDFVPDSGTNPVVPTAGGAVTMAGAHGINTVGSLNTLTFKINNAITLGDLSAIAANSGALTATTGDVIITAGDLTLPNTNAGGNQGIIKFGGTNWIHNFGTENTFVGPSSGNFTLTGDNNSCIGGSSLTALTSGSENSAVGRTTLAAVTSGLRNTAVGSGGQQGMTIGNNNSSIGNSALFGLTTGSGNTAIGQNALRQVMTGSNNIAVGLVAGQNLTGAESSNIHIGNDGTVGVSNEIRLGRTGSGAGQQNKLYLAGVDTVNVGSTAQVLTMASEQVGTAVITAGTNISVTPGANLITIAATGAGSFSWSVITANQTAAVNHGYFCNKGSALALALPAASAVGDVIEVSNINTALGVQFTQAANQQIFIGNTSTTLGATGTLSSSAVGDSLKIVCRTANLVWFVTSGWGNWTPA